MIANAACDQGECTVLAPSPQYALPLPVAGRPCIVSARRVLPVLGSPRFARNAKPLNLG